MTIIQYRPCTDPVLSRYQRFRRFLGMLHSRSRCWRCDACLATEAMLWLLARDDWGDDLP